MRKILLATVAGLGAWGMVASDASAQTTPAPSSSGTITGFSAGSSFPTLAPPQPGTVVVRLNGRLRFYAGYAASHDANNLTPGGANSPTGSLATNKVQDYGFIEYARLYPGFDGVAANGLKYGANLEIRQDASGGAGGVRGGPSISGQDPVRAELYFRRAWGYFGTDTFGTLRVGSIDQPTSQYLTGNFENFNDGGWNGDAPGFISGSIGPQWPFADQGSWYTTNKIVYLSPSLFGFDMGASYEPTTANLSGSVNCSSVAGNTASSAGSGLGCDNLSSSPFNAAAARRRNTFEVLLRYRGSFGPVGIAVTGAYDTGSHIADNSGLPYNNNPLVTSGVRYNYDGLSVGDFGAALTFGGLSFGGHYQTGRWNSYIGGLVPKGFHGSDAWIAGASYTFGPTIVGAHWFVNEGPGDLNNAFFGRQRREQGVAAGATYALAPGVSIYLSGLWGERKQNGFDFVNGNGVTNTNFTTGTTTNNTVTTSVLSLGTSFAW